MYPRSLYIMNNIYILLYTQSIRIHSFICFFILGLGLEIEFLYWYLQFVLKYKY